MLAAKVSFVLVDQQYDEAEWIGQGEYLNPSA